MPNKIITLAFGLLLAVPSLAAPYGPPHLPEGRPDMPYQVQKEDAARADSADVKNSMALIAQATDQLYQDQVKAGKIEAAHDKRALPEQVAAAEHGGNPYDEDEEDEESAEDREPLFYYNNWWNDTLAVIPTGEGSVSNDEKRSEPLKPIAFEPFPNGMLGPSNGYMPSDKKEEPVVPYPGDSAARDAKYNEKRQCTTNWGRGNCNAGIPSVEKRLDSAEPIDVVAASDMGEDSEPDADWNSESVGTTPKSILPAKRQSSAGCPSPNWAGGNCVNKREAVADEINPTHGLALPWIPGTDTAPEAPLPEKRQSSAGCPSPNWASGNCVNKREAADEMNVHHKVDHFRVPEAGEGDAGDRLPEKRQSSAGCPSPNWAGGNCVNKREAADEMNVHHKVDHFRVPEAVGDEGGEGLPEKRQSSAGCPSPNWAGGNCVN